MSRTLPGPTRTLVLLDLTMPLMDGEETFRRLREIESKAVVVLNTGFIEEERLATMMDAGLAGFVRRPYHPVELIAQIRSILATVARTVRVARESRPSFPSSTEPPNRGPVSGRGVGFAHCRLRSKDS